MRVLLLEHPRSIAPERCNDIANTPLSSCLISGYAAGMLKQSGHEVVIVEGYLDNLDYEEIGSRVRSFAPDILGVHMVYHWREDDALFGFLSRVRQEMPAVLIAAYGFYATISAADILRRSAAVDAVITGEAEQPFSHLADAVSSGKSLEGIPGIAVRKGSGDITFIPQEPARDLDMLPFPVRTDALYRLQEVNILGSRGCYGRCTFCYINRYYGRGIPWRGRSPENIAAEISSILAGQGKKAFYFTDPNFFGPGQAGQDRALRIAALLKPLHITFGIEGRVNDIHDRTIAALVEAGLRHILIGLESGRDESLRRMNKMTTVAQNEQALRILRRHGIEPNVGFIMFEPDSTLGDIRTNFEFLKRNDLLKNLPVTANVLYHHQIVLEGTRAFHELKQEGRLETSGSAYEGSALLRDPAVAALAGLMRRVTNLLFARMDGIWSGTLVEPPGMQRRYEEINRSLVSLFEKHLGMLERGEPPDGGHIGQGVREAAAAIEKGMGNFHAT